MIYTFVNTMKREFVEFVGLNFDFSEAIVLTKRLPVPLPVLAVKW